MKTEKTNLWQMIKISFPLASIWAGAQVGPALASGSTVASYFVKYGSMSIWSIVICMFVCGIFIFFGCEAGRVYGAKDYNESLYAALWKFGDIPAVRKTASVINDILTICACTLTCSLMYNMLSNVFIAVFGVGYNFALALCLIIFTVFLMWGTGLLEKLSTPVAIGLAVCFLLMFILGWTQYDHDMVTHFLVDTWDLPEGFKAGALMCWAYLGIQYGTCKNACMYTKKYTSWKNSLVTAVLGWFINCVFLILSSLNVMQFYPESITQNAPHMWIILEFYQNTPWMQWIYYICMFLACISTAVAVMLGVIIRFRRLIFKATSKVNEKTQTIILAFLVSAVPIALSFAGLLTIMSTYYSKVGTANMWFGLITYGILLPISYFALGKAKREKMAEEVLAAAPVEAAAAVEAEQ